MDRIQTTTIRFTLGLLVITLISLRGFSQYTDYLGAGHNHGISVISSHNSGSSSAMKSINGDGMD
ncbi:MAG: hypothetical protein MJD61_21420, partial [Proteobacteria bacterium]|nr:hypothetical protein [Pseudomonadota bacterium]